MEAQPFDFLRLPEDVQRLVRQLLYNQELDALRLALGGTARDAADAGGLAAAQRAAAPTGVYIDLSAGPLLVVGRLREPEQQARRVERLRHVQTLGLVYRAEQMPAGGEDHLEAWRQEESGRQAAAVLRLLTTTGLASWAGVRHLSLHLHPSGRCGTGLMPAPAVLALLVAAMPGLTSMVLHWRGYTGNPLEQQLLLGSLAAAQQLHRLDLTLNNPQGTPAWSPEALAPLRRLTGGQGGGGCTGWGTRLQHNGQVASRHTVGLQAWCGTVQLACAHSPPRGLLVGGAQACAACACAPMTFPLHPVPSSPGRWPAWRALRHT